MHTLASLLKLNQACRAPINQLVVDRANAIVEKIESRDFDKPACGDVVQITCANGRVYKHAHLHNSEWGNHKGEMCVCTKPYTPYVGNDGDSSNISGGYFQDIKIADLKKVGETQKVFWSFLNGAGASRDVNFVAKVSVWEYKGDPDAFY